MALDTRPTFENPGSATARRLRYHIICTGSQCGEKLGRVRKWLHFDEVRRTNGDLTPLTYCRDVMCYALHLQNLFYVPVSCDVQILYI